MYRTYTGGEAPPITAIQNTQAPSEFLTTSIPKQKPWILLIFGKIFGRWGEGPPIRTIQNTQAPSEFLAVQQIRVPKKIWGAKNST